MERRGARRGISRSLDRLRELAARQLARDVVELFVPLQRSARRSFAGATFQAKGIDHRERVGAHRLGNQERRGSHEANESHRDMIQARGRFSAACGAPNRYSETPVLPLPSLSCGFER